MTPRLHVLLGAGGVGKTTLAAGYALALARQPGRRVGLLGIDPSHRLKDALGVSLVDEATAVPGAGTLRAALLQPPESVRRWATEACADESTRERLFRNPFFLALADRLATATDIFAAARVAEWAEHDRDLTDLVVDTAPGLNAIEFLTRPERVSAFLGGRLVGWLRWMARGQAGGEGVRGGALRIVGGLVRIAGSRTLGDLAEFFSLVDAMLAQMLARVRVTQRWLREPSTEILLVTSVRHDGAALADGLARALSGTGVVPGAVVLNRALALDLPASRSLLEAAASNAPGAAPVIRYALAYAAIQARVLEDIGSLAGKIAVVPDTPGLDGDDRLAALLRAGELLRAALE